MRARLRTALLRAVLKLRGWVAVPLASAARRLAIWRSSGSKRLEREADDAWMRGEGLAAMEHWRALERAEPQRAAWALKVSQVEREHGDFKAAERVLRDARDRGIADERIELGILRHARQLYRSNAAVEEAEAIVADPKSSTANVFHSAQYLLYQNQLDAARAGFARLLGDADYGHLARGCLAAVEMLAQNRAAGRPDIPGWLSPVQNSIEVREPSSDTLVVGFVLQEGTLGLPVNAVHAMLSSKGVNALYLYDSRQLFHLAGSDRFGPGWEAMLAGVRAYAAKLGTRKLVTTGSSGTGYTAIRAALDLNADGAVAFAPSTLMIPTTNPGVSRGAYTVRRLQRDVLPMMRNLRPLVRDNQTHPRIEIYHGTRNRRDIMHAGNLAGLPGVTLHPIQGLARHDCATEMAYRGYRDLLGPFTVS